MLKFLECPDIHADERWIDVTLNCLDKIIETAKKEQVDFVAFPGDLHNKNFYLTKAYNQLREKIKELLKVCPVCAVVGTPGHETESMYGPLEDIGFVLLRPNNIYGYKRDRFIKTQKRFNIFKISNDKIPDCILFGVPELTTKHILSNQKLTIEQANKETVRLFEKYIDDYVAPMRMKYSDTPAIMLFHGEVSDSLKENANDIITKSSAIMIHTEIFERAGLDRISLGHRHIPWESEKICAGYSGYCGIDDRSWGYLDFIPGMNLIEIIDNKRPYNEIIHETQILKIPYGTPMRQKITKSFNLYDPNIAYWLVTDNPDDKCPAGHPWSRITYDEKRIETQRITEEQAAKINNLADLYRAMDDTVTDRIIKKVQSIKEHIPEQFLNPVDFKLLGVEIAGCILFNSKTIKWDLGKLPSGLSSLMGDNGAGKSSTVAFCHPYPIIIGKDTGSGRMSAIKDFFDQPVSYIKKWAIINGVEHIHNIQIQGAHTQNPKVVCSLTVNNTPILDKGTFDEMYNKCEELYGSFSDYMLTSFYVQPLQSRNGTSGLMMANMTDIRDLVQSIAGVDRENEKRFALDQVAEIKSQINDTENWLQGAEQFDTDIEPLEAQIKELSLSLQIKNNDLHNIDSVLKETTNEQKKLQDKKIKNDIEIQRQQQNNDRIGVIDLILEKDNNRIHELQDQLSQKEDILVKLLNDKKAQELERKQNEEKNRYDKSVFEYEFGNTKIINAIKNIETQCANIIDKIKILDKKCPQCGYIDPENKNEIEKLKTQLDILSKNLDENKLKLNQIIKPVKPEFKIINGLLTLENRNQLQTILNEINSSDKLIEEINNNIESLLNEKKRLLEMVYDIDTTIDDWLSEVSNKIDNLSNQKNNFLQNISVIETQIKNLNDSIEKTEKIKTQIKEKKESLKNFELDLIDWKYIASMLQSDKIPALELSLITDSIDAEANRLISEYETGRYQFRTITQDVSKKGLKKDEFDIRIYDSERGIERSFLRYSVGQKAFFNDAYVKALIRKRNERMQRNYSPIVSDEADAPIQPHRIQEYYEMQKKYFDGKPNQVIVISHAPDTHNYIQNSVNVKDLICQ